MANIFVSIPMSGRTVEEQWNDIVNAASVYCEAHPEENYFFFDNREVIIEGPCIPGREPLLYLAEALKTMATCDDVIFGGNWKEARGCQVERLVYELYFKKKGEES